MTISEGNLRCLCCKELTEVRATTNNKTAIYIVSPYINHYVKMHNKTAIDLQGVFHVNVNRCYEAKMGTLHCPSKAKSMKLMRIIINYINCKIK